MKRHAWLSTFLFAAVLSPVLLQTETCESSVSARLAVLELWVPDLQGENVIEGFDPNVLQYRAGLPESEDTAVLRVEAQDPMATIRVQYDGQPIQLLWGYGFLDVPLEGSELQIMVTAPTDDGGSYRWTYTVFIERGGEGTLLIDIDVEVTSAGGVYDVGAFEVQP
jgi:hypothetical protein